MHRASNFLSFQSRSSPQRRKRDNFPAVRNFQWSGHVNIRNICLSLINFMKDKAKRIFLSARQQMMLSWKVFKIWMRKVAVAFKIELINIKILIVWRWCAVISSEFYAWVKIHLIPYYSNLNRTPLLLVTKENFSNFSNLINNSSNTHSYRRWASDFDKFLYFLFSALFHLRKECSTFSYPKILFQNDVDLNVF